MQAIVLAGGFGTRLRSVCSDVPKSMAPIHDKPFLAYLLTYLQSMGVKRVILPVHYLAENIMTYFQSAYAGMMLDYVEETEPLGTGGAMVNALSRYQDNAPIFVLNGDTLVKLDFQAMYAEHVASGAAMTMALRQMEDCSRYGKVMTDNQRVVSFQEKGESGAGFINAGVYLIQPDLFRTFDLPPPFSFEQDFLRTSLSRLHVHAFMAKDYFIDIGIPEDYARAKQDFSPLQE